MTLETVLYLVLGAGFFFLMMRFGCGAHAMRHSREHSGAGSHDSVSSPGGGARRIVPGQAIDPVCGMTVETASAGTTTHDGKTYYFCSTGCREKFEAAPASFTKEVTAAPRQKAHHGCC